VSSKDNPTTSHQAAANRATQQYRDHHDMPEGTQAQHWTKVRSAERTGMPAERMNRNISPLQSRRDGQPVTQLTTEGTRDLGTRYTVHERVEHTGELSDATRSFTTEHKFADRYLIPAEQARLAQENPSIDPHDLCEAAGAQARWKMVGAPGEVSPELVAEIGPFAAAQHAAPTTAPAPDTHQPPSNTTQGPSASQISQALETAASPGGVGVDTPPSTAFA
jgi:hypothetical protein